MKLKCPDHDRMEEEILLPCDTSYLLHLSQVGKDSTDVSFS